MSSQKLTLVQWLDDLCVRFIINAPAEDLESVHRIFFQVEEAQWFYEDFIRPLDTRLPALSLQLFSRKIFKQCPIFAGYTIEQHDAALAQFLHFKQTVPVRGVIILNDALDHVLLVKGWRDLACAIREAYEETGYDLEAAGIVDSRDEDVPFVQHTLRDQDLKFFLFRGVPMDAHFAPRTRKEISKIQWHRLTDLPSYRKTKQNIESDTQTAAVKSGKYYMVAPFLSRLKRWIKEERTIQKRAPPATLRSENLNSEVQQTEVMNSDEYTEMGRDAEPKIEVEADSAGVEELEESAPTGIDQPVASIEHSGVLPDPSWSLPEDRNKSTASGDRTLDAQMLLSVLRTQAQTAKQKKSITTQTQSLLSIFRSGTSKPEVPPSPAFAIIHEGTSKANPPTVESSYSVQETSPSKVERDALPKMSTTTDPDRPVPQMTDRSLALLSILQSDRRAAQESDKEAASSLQPASKYLDAGNASQEPEAPKTPVTTVPHLTKHQDSLLRLFSGQNNNLAPVELSEPDRRSTPYLSSPSASSTATIRLSNTSGDPRGLERSGDQSSFGLLAGSSSITNHPFAGLPLSSPQPEKLFSVSKSIAKSNERETPTARIGDPSIGSPPPLAISAMTVLSRPLVAAPPSPTSSGQSLPMQLNQNDIKTGRDIAAALPTSGSAKSSVTADTAPSNQGSTRYHPSVRARGSRTPVVSAKQADELLSSFTRPKPSGRARLFDPMFARRPGSSGSRASHTPNGSPRLVNARQLEKQEALSPTGARPASHDYSRGSNIKAEEAKSGSVSKRDTLIPATPEQVPFKPTILRRPQVSG